MLRVNNRRNAIQIKLINHLYERCTTKTNKEKLLCKINNRTILKNYCHISTLWLLCFPFYVLAFCPSGHNLNATRSGCVPCERGSYKNNAESLEARFAATCTLCTIGLTTETTASSAAGNCTIRKYHVLVKSNSFPPSIRIELNIVVCVSFVIDGGLFKQTFTYEICIVIILLYESFLPIISVTCSLQHTLYFYE